MKRIRVFSYILTVGVGVFFATAQAQAAVTWKIPNQLSVTGGEQKITLFDGHFPGGASVAAGDVDGDGVDEYIVGAGHGGGPQVEVYTQSGQKIASWFTLDRRTTAGIFVAAGDIDGDGRAEIVVGPDDGFRPQVDVYSGSGAFLGALTAFENSYTGGVRVSIIPWHDGQAGRILTASGAGRDQEIRVFSWPGRQQEASWSPYGANVIGNGLHVAGGWSDVLNEPVIVASPDAGRAPLVRVYGLTSKKLQAAWFAYDRVFKGGVFVAVRDDVVFTAPGSSGGPNIRRFTIRGHEAVSWMAFASNYRGGVRVAAASVAGSLTSVTVPINVKLSDPDTTVGGKQIVISLSKQEMKLKENGRVISTRRVSTGKWSTPTPTGNFKTHNKTRVAYSKAYGLYMEYWMAITPDGKYGVHSLPYWKLKNGGKYYEGASHIGTPVSHGCIRQTVADAKSLFDWAPVGTPVKIVK